MGRLDRDFQPEDRQYLPLTQEASRPTCERGSVDIGRGGSDESHQTGSTSRTRSEYRDERGRTYLVSDSELGTLVEIGKFRSLRVEDLTDHRYGKDDDSAQRDLRNLKLQGLIRQRLSYPEKTAYVALTKAGHSLADSHRARESGVRQQLYHGFVKSREANHDAALYRLYQQKQAEIESTGGRVTRVVLDFELKRSINRRLSKLSSEISSDLLNRKQEIAHEHGLKVVNGKIPLPDLRLEYEGPDQDRGKVDLELATGHYHRAELAAKAEAGFALYAIASDAARLRPAMPDPEIMQDILSL
jgi:hypothetical protein